MESTADAQDHRSLLRQPAVILVSVLLLAFFNAGADYVNDRTLHIPLFLDTIGTLLANALIGAVVAALFFTGDTGHAVDYVASALYSLGQSVFSAAFLARLPVNVADKAIAVLVAYVAYRLSIRGVERVDQGLPAR